jgi:hypothetical protein
MDAPRKAAEGELHPSDMGTAFLEEAAGQHIPEYAEAKGYNLPFGEDKRFRTRFVRAKDLGDALWDEIRTDYAESRNKSGKSFEGTLVYVLCEDHSEIHVARAAATAVADQNVAPAVPHAFQPFAETLLGVKACRHYLPPNEPDQTPRAKNPAADVGGSCLAQDPAGRFPRGLVVSAFPSFNSMHRSPGAAPQGRTHFHQPMQNPPEPPSPLAGHPLKAAGMLYF